MLTDVERLNSLWAAPFPHQELLNSGSQEMYVSSQFTGLQSIVICKVWEKTLSLGRWDLAVGPSQILVYPKTEGCLEARTELCLSKSTPSDLSLSSRPHYI